LAIFLLFATDLAMNSYAWVTVM